MEIRRFFTTADKLENGKIVIDGDEFLHMTKVLRYKVGFKATVCLNDGIERLCTIKQIGKDSALLNVDENIVQDAKHAKVTLFAGLLKNNKLDFAIQKAVELGVDEIVPFTSRNCAETKFSKERANKIALESAKQCGSAYLTKVADLKTFDEIKHDFCKYNQVLFAYENEKENRIKDCAPYGDNVALVVGCEGGFTEDEVKDAVDCGARVITLGKRILRAETASIVASTMLLDSLGELDYE